MPVTHTEAWLGRDRDSADGQEAEKVDAARVAAARVEQEVGSAGEIKRQSLKLREAPQLFHPPAS